MTTLTYRGAYQIQLENQFSTELKSQHFGVIYRGFPLTKRANIPANKRGFRKIIYRGATLTLGCEKSHGVLRA